MEYQESHSTKEIGTSDLNECMHTFERSFGNTRKHASCLCTSLKNIVIN